MISPKYSLIITLVREELEDTKGAGSIRKSVKGQTTYCLKKKIGQRDKQRSTKHAHKTKDRHEHE